jgi:hypothetical protein
MTHNELEAFGARYAAAWSSGDPSRVVACFAADGCIVINDSEPFNGAEGIHEVALDWMTTFADLVVVCDRLVDEEGELRWYWTMTGTTSSGDRVEISGYEALVLSDDGLIRRAEGHFDQAEYDRQMGTS